MGHPHGGVPQGRYLDHSTTWFRLTTSPLHAQCFKSMWTIVQCQNWVNHPGVLWHSCHVVTEKWHEDKCLQSQINVTVFQQAPITFRLHAQRPIWWSRNWDSQTSCVILGLTVTDELTWNLHIDNIVAKAAKRVYLVYQLKRVSIFYYLREWHVQWPWQRPMHTVRWRCDYIRSR